MSVNRKARQALGVASSGVLGIAVATLNIGCSSMATGGYVPPEALGPPAAALSTSLATFASDAQTNTLGTYRRRVRNDLFVDTLVTYVETGNKAGRDKLLRDQKAETFVCLPEYGYTRVATRLGNITAVGTAVGARVAKPSDDLSALVISLSTNYSIVVGSTLAPDTYEKWLATDAGNKCHTSVTGGDPFAARTYVGTEFALAAIPAAIEVFNTVWAIVKPVLVGTLQNVDLERRNAAVRDYFADDANVSALKSNVAATEEFLDKEFTLMQTRTAGETIANVRILYDPMQPHWTKVESIVTTNPCLTAIQGLPKDKTSPAGVSCVRSALMATNAALVAALDSADAFDLALTQQLPKERLSAQIGTLQDIALGKQPAEDKVKALWAAALRYVALYKTVQGANSSDNKKKIKDAWDAFQATLK